MAASYDKGGQSQNARLFVADAATGQAQTVGGKYDVPAWSPDSTRIAASFDGGLAILDATTRHQIERLVLPKRDAPSQDIVGRPTARACWPVFTARTGRRRRSAERLLPSESCHLGLDASLGY